MYEEYKVNYPIPLVIFQKKIQMIYLTYLNYKDDG